MSIQIVSDPAVADWIIDRLEDERGSSRDGYAPYVAYGVVKDGVAVCGVLYNWFRPLKHAR